VRIYLVQDSEGTIVATAPCGLHEIRAARPGVSEATFGNEAPPTELFQVEVRPTPLPGQTVHEVVLPAELEELSGTDLHHALLRYRLGFGESVLSRPEA
jgi:hypothetical protein